MMLLSIYHPGSSPHSSSLNSRLEVLAIYNSQSIITGVLNIHLENPGSMETTSFNYPLRQVDLMQHLAESTHILGGWLDFVIMGDDCMISLSNLHTPPMIYPHFVQNMYGWKNMDWAAFRASQQMFPILNDLCLTTFPLWGSLGHNYM